MTSLASLSDLGVRLGLDLSDDSRAEALLADVSARVTNYTGCTFTTTTDDEVDVDVCCGKAVLPNGPVISIDSVEIDGNPVTYTWTAGRTIKDLQVIGPVTVTYTWGYDAVPDDVIAVVCQIAGRAYGVNPQNAANTSESLGDWSIGTGAAGAAGPLGMMNDERGTLNRYKARPGAVRMGSWAW